jgi:hypothetical protein
MCQKSESILHTARLSYCHAEQKSNKHEKKKKAMQPASAFPGRNDRALKRKCGPMRFFASS